MTTFDKREEGFERKFALDEELQFKANARRNKLLGLWAAGHFDRGQALWSPALGKGAFAAWRDWATHDLTPELARRESEEALRRTEQRAVVLQLERLMGYPMVRERVETGQLTLHGWHYVIEDGEVHVFDVRSGTFVAASQAEHSGTGPYMLYDDGDGDGR